MFCIDGQERSGAAPQARTGAHPSTAPKHLPSHSTGTADSNPQVGTSGLSALPSPPQTAAATAPNPLTPTTAVALPGLAPAAAVPSPPTKGAAPLMPPTPTAGAGASLQQPASRSRVSLRGEVPPRVSKGADLSSVDAARGAAKPRLPYGGEQEQNGLSLFAMGVNRNKVGSA